MRKVSKRLLILEIIVILLLLVNNFVSSILSSYLKIAFLVVLTIITYYMFGFERDRHHLWKGVFVEMLIFLMSFFLLYYLFGLITSFTRINNYFSWQGLVAIFIPLILTIIIKEFLRYMMLSRCGNYRILYILTCVMFILIDLIEIPTISADSLKYKIFIYIAVYLIPAITRNILCTYVSYNVGYKPVIFYLLVTSLYEVTIPIIPNPNQYLYSIIWMIVPLVLMYLLFRYFKKEKHDYKLESKYFKKKISGLIFPTILIIVIVYFFSGYFHYQVVAIASGSMEKAISKGDIVVIEKFDGNVDSLEIGQILAYRYDNILIVHRIVKKKRVNNETYFYTKGDANNSIDNVAITKSMIVGTVSMKIPYIGYPTVWINEM